MRTLLAVAVSLLLAAPPAAACLNDAFTGEEERQFRARYADERPTSRVDLSTGSLGALGAAVVVGCVLAAARRLRRAA